MRGYLIWALMLLAFCGCSKTVSYGDLSIEDEAAFPYKHAAISPDTDAVLRKKLVRTLKKNGFIVFDLPVYLKVKEIRPGNNVAVFNCQKEATWSGGGVMSAVECFGYDLHTEDIFFHGYGEYFHPLADRPSYIAATKYALKKLPVIGDKGRITLEVDLPLVTRKKRYSYEKNGPVRKTAGQGTGWLMPNGCIATNFHVVGDGNNIEVEAFDGKKFKASVHASDRLNDLALLKVSDPDFDYPALPVSSTPANVGSGVFTLGFPLTDFMGTEVKFTYGKISSRSGMDNDPRLYQISVPVQPGNSGGPLINENGEAVGVVTSKLHAAEIFKWTGDLPQNVNYAMKVLYLLPMTGTETIRQTRVLPAGKDRVENLVKRAEKSVFKVVSE